MQHHTKGIPISFMLLGVLFVVCLITSNLLETKILQVWGIGMTAGLLVFPISYIINDCIVEVWGFKKARLLIWLGFAMNFLVICFTQIAILLPAAPYWEGATGFNFVFGFAPRIVFASLCAFLLGSFTNAYVMSKMKIASGGKHFSIRAIVSTLAGESIDSLIFFPIAFFGMMPIEKLLQIMVVQVILKSLYEIVVLPLTVVTVRYLKKKEELDVFDEDVSYNILKIREID
ncbi:membrane protein [Bacteroidia bacterium]|nr:membrane protein [Bacteroidia bacterium]